MYAGLIITRLFACIGACLRLMTGRRAVRLVKYAQDGAVAFTAHDALERGAGRAKRINRGEGGAGKALPNILVATLRLHIC